MVKTTYHYPGDPVEQVILLFGAEFNKLQPNREIVVGDQHFPVEDIICDTCNAGVGALDPCALTPGRLYCWDCYGKYIKPHTVPGTEVGLGIQVMEPTA